MSTAAHLPSRYHPVAIGLHWVMALALVGLFVVGLYMVDLPFRRSGSSSTTGTNGPGSWC